MPKAKFRLAINLNLFRPQSNPEKLPFKLFRWLLSSGRYIFVFVEAVVLVAFITRFKLDADLASKKEAIEEQVPYIESLKDYEVLIKKTQLKLSTIDTAKKDYVDWPIIFKKIADQTPQDTKILHINIDGKVGTATIHITGQTPTGSDLSSFIAGLKEDNTLNNVSLTSIGLEEGVVKFAIDASAQTGNLGKKNL